MLEVIQVLEKMTWNIWKTFEKKMHIAHDNRKKHLGSVDKNKPPQRWKSFVCLFCIKSALHFWRRWGFEIAKPKLFILCFFFHREQYAFFSNVFHMF